MNSEIIQILAYNKLHAFQTPQFDLFSTNTFQYSNN
jgi:hypothetical protein